MRDELVLRVGVVAGAALVSIGVAIVLRMGRSIRRYRIVLDGFGPGVFFFSSATCSTCARMREVLADRPEVTEVPYEAGDFPAEVRRVPAVSCLNEAGEGWIAYGAVSQARLDRWIADGP